MNKPISGLYVVIDSAIVPLNEATKVAQNLIDAGVRLIQLRAKGAGAGEMLKAACAISTVAKKTGATFIVNDRVDVALMSKADGVHLGQDDLSPEAARSILGPLAIIGVSTHNVEEALEAKRRQADYISFGPIFKTQTKGDASEPKGLDGLKRFIASGMGLPVVAIGGLTKETAPMAMEAGATAVAMISEILLSKDPAAKAKAIINCMLPSLKKGERGGFK